MYLIFGIIILLAALIMPNIIINSFLSGLILYVTKVLPGIFVNLFCSYIFLKYLKSKETFISITVLSLLTGYPNGAFLCSNVSNASNNKKFFENLTGILNISSPVFLKTFVYENFFKGVSLAAFIAAVYLPVVILTGLNFMIFKRKPKSNKSQVKKDKNTEKLRFVDVFCDSVTFASEKSLIIGCFIIMFMIISCVLNEAFNGNLVYSIIAVPLEITNGMIIIDSLFDSSIKYIGILVLNAFGGICVLMQSLVLCPNLNIKKYIYQKLELCAITALTAMLLVYVKLF